MTAKVVLLCVVLAVLTLMLWGLPPGPHQAPLMPSAQRGLSLFGPWIGLAATALTGAVLISRRARSQRLDRRLVAAVTALARGD